MGSDILRNSSCQGQTPVLGFWGKEMTIMSSFSGVGCERTFYKLSEFRTENFFLFAAEILGSYRCKELWVSFRLRLHISVSGTKIDKIF